MVVFVEASVLEDAVLARDSRFQEVRDKLQTFRDGDDLQVITIGSLKKRRYNMEYVSRDFPHYDQRQTDRKIE